MTKSKSKSQEKATLVIRSAEEKDLDEIIGLAQKVYPNMPTYKKGHIRGHINSFADGSFVAVYEGQIVGYSASFLIKEPEARLPHTWAEITGGAYNSRHDPKGDVLYGMEIMVDPAVRGLRIGRRFYEERKRLVRKLRLRGIMIVGRMPGFARRKKKYETPQAYVEAVLKREVRDNVISFQIRNGFEFINVFKDYLPIDRDSDGYGVLLKWTNPKFNEELLSDTTYKSGLTQETVRVTTVQYQQRRVQSFDEFLQIVEYFVDVASDYRSDFVVFPEWFTMQLLSMEHDILDPKKSMIRLSEHTPMFVDSMQDLAVKYNVNIIGGSTATFSQKTKRLKNVAYVFRRDGAIFEQAKLHPTPNERYWWDLEGGSDLQAIPTDCGTIGVLICYDAEFPELSRHLVDQGMKILFVPFCTDERQSYNRVRYCAAARAIENQIYVALSGNVGNLPRVENMDIQYAQSCILSPCDFPFYRDGIAADTTPNVEMVAVADLRLDPLMESRRSGTTQQLRDRRHDLYHITWKEEVGAS
jgi:predicted amidohydrolase/GNAT superfamily N-acetyltransferase